MRIRFTQIRSKRWTGAAGLAFVVLGVMGGFGLGHTSTMKDTWSGAQVVHYVSAHHSNLAGDHVISALVVVVLLLFANALRSTITEAGSYIGSLLGAFAAVTAALLLASLGASLAMVQLGSRTSEAGTEVLWRLSVGTSALSSLPLGLLIAASAVAVWRTGALARWTAVVALLAAGVEIGFGLIYQVARSWGHLDANGPQIAMIWAFVFAGALLLERRTMPQREPVTSS